jgi:DNA-binding NtrC family response regulator
MTGEINMQAQTKILVVDDNEVVRLSLLRSLRNASRSVQLADSAAEAVRLLEQERFDVVLLDLRMPGMDGLSFLKILKQRWPECEAIVITGYPTIETAVEALRLGAFNYLAKPVGPDEIVSAANDATIQKQWTLRREPRMQAAHA